MNKTRLALLANFAAVLSLSAMPSAYADTSHLVVSGDTLWGIAQTSDTSVLALKQQNGLKTDLIYSDQKLTVPEKPSASPTTPPSSPASSTSPSSSADTGSSQVTAYTVRAGDTLWQIAQNHHSSVQALQSMNQLQSDTIYVGESLQISVDSQASSSITLTDPQLADAPSKLIPIYKDAGNKYGIPWTVLAAIHKIETHYSTERHITSSAGAQGPMQFLPSTFAAYGVTAPGHSGAPDIGDAEDAIYSTANMLAQNGFQASPDQAIYAYNHSSYYVNSVKQLSEV